MNHKNLYIYPQKTGIKLLVIYDQYNDIIIEYEKIIIHQIIHLNIGQNLDLKKLGSRGRHETNSQIKFKTIMFSVKTTASAGGAPYNNNKQVIFKKLCPIY